MDPVQTDLELRETLKRLRQIEDALDFRKKTRAMEFYTPNPAQLRAHKSVADIILFCGGNRSGKSTFGAIELVWHLTRKYPSWYPLKRRYTRPIKAVVVATSNQIIERVIEPKVMFYLPKDYVKDMRRVTGGFLNRIICKDGSTVDFLTSEQDDMMFESQDWDFYWGDEPQKKRKFEAIQRGLIDRNGRIILTFTPLVEPWMKEELVDKADGEHIEAFIIDMMDNRFDIEGNPILTEETINRITQGWAEDVKETRLHGKFFHLRGTVYPEFSEVHQLEFGYQYPDPVIAILDPHDRQPHHVIWAVVDRTDDLYIHSELSVHCTVQELAKTIKFIEKQNGYKMRRRLIDPNFGRKPLITTGRNMIEELARSGCPGWYEADDPKEEGRLKVKEYLHYQRDKEISHTNRPKLFFHKKRVPMTIRSIRNHQYEEWIGKIASERDDKEKTKDKDTHGADCVRYLCMSNPTYSRYEEGAYEPTQAYY